MDEPSHSASWHRVFSQGTAPTSENKHHFCTLMTCQAERAVAQAHQCSPSLKGHAGGALAIAPGDALAIAPVQDRVAPRVFVPPTYVVGEAPDASLDFNIDRYFNDS